MYYIYDQLNNPQEQKVVSIPVSISLPGSKLGQETGYPRPVCSQTIYWLSYPNYIYRKHICISYNPRFFLSANRANELFNPTNKHITQTSPQSWHVS
jgi:hypothetical protein